MKRWIWSIFARLLLLLSVAMVVGPSGCTSARTSREHIAVQGASRRVDNGVAQTVFMMGLEDGSSGWADLGKNNLQIQLCANDTAEEGMRAVGASAEGAGLLLPEVYRQAATGKIAAGHKELVGRMEGPYQDGDEFIVCGFIRKGNRIVAHWQYVRGPQERRSDGSYDWKRAYFRAPIPQDLPPGRYYVWIGLTEYFRAEGKLVIAPKSDIGAFEHLTCMFDVPDPAGRKVAWLMPGSALSVTEAIQHDFAFAAVCVGADIKGRFQFADGGSNYVPGVFLAIQPVRIVEVLAGDVKPGDLELVYKWTDAGLRHEECPAEQKVIWMVGRPFTGSQEFWGMKALTDTPKNRKAVKDAANLR